MKITSKYKTKPYIDLNMVMLSFSYSFGSILRPLMVFWHFLVMMERISVCFPVETLLGWHIVAFLLWDFTCKHWTSESFTTSPPFIWLLWFHCARLLMSYTRDECVCVCVHTHAGVWSSICSAWRRIPGGWYISVLYSSNVWTLLINVMHACCNIRWDWSLRVSQKVFSGREPD